MKNICFYVILTLFSATLSSCEKDIDNTELKKSYQYEAIVKGKGLDCGDTYLVEMKKLTGEATIAEGIYYADNLPPNLKVAGLKIKLNSRNPTSEELYACTTMGPGYSHVVVIESEKADK